MKIASIAQIKARFSAYVKESQSGPVIVTCNGKPAAVLLNIVDEDELEGLLLASCPSSLPQHLPHHLHEGPHGRR